MRSALLLVPLLGTLACGPKTSTDNPKGGDPVADQGSIRLILNDPKQFERPMNACEAEHCRALLELIEGAGESIDFAIYGMRNQTAIMDALVAAKARGVEIRGVVDRDLEGENC